MRIHAPPPPSPPQDVIDRDLGVTFDAIASLGEAKRLLNEVREGSFTRLCWQCRKSTFDAIASLGEAKRLLNEVREGGLVHTSL